MLDVLISNKTRIKLLFRFFLNPEMRTYLRELGREFSESSNAVRIELNRFEKAGLIHSEREGNRKYYQANQEYPLFLELQRIAMKNFGIDQIYDAVINKLGDVNQVYLLGNLSKGLNSSIIDLAIISSEIDRTYLAKLIEVAEKSVKRKIRCLVLEPHESSIVPEPNMLIYDSSGEKTVNKML